jgi:hypothetical protein
MQKFLISRALVSVVLLAVLVAFGSVMPSATHLARAASSAPHQPADVVVCLLETFYQSHGSPVTGDPSPMDLTYRYQFRNKGSEPTTVTFIHISVFGRHSNGNIIPTNLDASANIPVGGNQLTGPIVSRVYVGPGTEERQFLYAYSQLTWTNGHGARQTHQNNGTEWTNDPACTS